MVSPSVCPLRQGCIRDEWVASAFMMGGRQCANCSRLSLMSSDQRVSSAPWVADSDRSWIESSCFRAVPDAGFTGFI